MPCAHPAPCLPCPEGAHCQYTCACPHCNGCGYLCHGFEALEFAGGHVEVVLEPEVEAVPTELPELEADEGETESVILTPKTNKTIREA
jgi:hypothetical protein